MDEKLPRRGPRHGPGVFAEANRPLEWRRGALATRDGRSAGRAWSGIRRRRRELPVAPEVEVRVHQPRHHEPVLRPDPVRRGRRVRAGQLLLPVDRVDDEPTSGEMVNAINAAISVEGRRDRGRGDRQDRLRGPDQESARRRASRSCPTTPTVRAPGRTPAWPTSARTSTCRGFADGRSGSPELVPSGDVALFIATPGALNIQPRIDGAMAAIKAVGQAIKSTAIAHRRHR